MRVLLLGGTGFIGDALVERLRSSGHDVVTASRSTRADVPFDATSPESVRRVLEGRFDAVVNLAGAGLTAGTADASVMTAVNSDLPPLLLDLLSDRMTSDGTNPVALVHAASSTERLPGQVVDESEYSRTKAEGTQALRRAAAASGRPVSILTIHNTYGPGQPRGRFVAAITDALSAGRPVRLNFPDRVRDFVHLDDVTASLEAALDDQPEGLREAHVGTGIGLTLTEAALEIASAVGADPGLVGMGPAPGADPNPVTVSPDLGGTFGTCTTSFGEGIRRTIEES